VKKKAPGFRDWNRWLAAEFGKARGRVHKKIDRIFSAGLDAVTHLTPRQLGQRIRRKRERNQKNPNQKELL
jgi:hypothetical protein